MVLRSDGPIFPPVNQMVLQLWWCPSPCGWCRPLKHETPSIAWLVFLSVWSCTVRLLLGRRVRCSGRFQVKYDLADVLGRDIGLLGLRVDGDENHLRLALDAVDKPVAATFASRC